MPIRVVRLGTKRTEGEGLRLGTVRRPPRGVPKSEFASRDFYDVVPWNYTIMQIPEAWQYANGSGIQVGLTDTGIGFAAGELQANFTSGMSSGRLPVQWEGTPPTQNPSAGYDLCGHGTKMASIIAGPRNGQNIVGVAWKANLRSVRVDNDVIMAGEAGDVENRRLGIRTAAADSRIIAMAWGTMEFQYSSIVDEISYWYYNFGRLFIAAAGTTECAWYIPKNIVAFPANQNSIVTAVTRLDPNGSIGCESHYGIDVDFAAYGNQQATDVSNGISGFTGSSNATAVISGLAALAWSQNPGLSRTQVLSGLIYAASPAGGLSNTIGWGVPNALCAVKHMCTAWIEGPSLVEQTGTYTFLARQAASPSVTYLWSTGATTPSIQRTYSVSPGTEYNDVLWVTITDPSDGRQRTVNKSVYVRYPYQCPTCA